MTTSLTFLERHPLIEYGILGNTYEKKKIKNTRNTNIFFDFSK